MKVMFFWVTLKTIGNWLWIYNETNDVKKTRRFPYMILISRHTLSFATLKYL